MSSSGVDKLAMLESRMSMTAHGFGAPGTPQDFSIGFAERSNPGRAELSSAAEEMQAAAKTTARCPAQQSAAAAAPQTR